MPGGKSQLSQADLGNETRFPIFSDEYQQQLDRVWQNLFALTITLGYDRNLLNNCIRTVAMGNLISRIAYSERPPDEPEGQPIKLRAPWSPERIREGAQATVILPPEVFPLPPGPSADQSPRPIEPYAIGDLQMVRQNKQCR